MIQLSAGLAKRDDLCAQKFAVRLTKSEKFSYDHNLSVAQIRTLLYFKALKKRLTSVAQIADDLLLPRTEVISALQKLRSEGFVSECPMHTQALPAKLERKAANHKKP